VDEDDLRRIGVAGKEEVVAVAFAGSIALIELGLRNPAIGRGRRLPARVDLHVLRHALTVVVFHLVVQHARSPVDM